MLDEQIIELTKGPWPSPMVLVQNKDRSWRFCIGFRQLNPVTQKDAYQLLHMDQVLGLLWGAQYFSMLDLASGYWQVAIAEADPNETAFCMHQGLWGEWGPVPRNVEDVSSFHGFCSYYQSFVEGFATISHPLTQLTTKCMRFVWSVGRLSCN